MSLLGLDVGTGGCKAGVFSTDGRARALAFREYPIRRPGPGAAELDSREAWSLAKECIREVVARTPDDPVTALCVSALGEAATPVDGDGGILGPSILSSDARGGEYVDRLRAAFPPRAFFAINANVPAVHYTLPKLLWMREHRPAEFRAARRFLLWDALPAVQLGAEPFVSYSHASRTLLFDLRQETWSGPLLDWSGLDPALLPPCRPAGAIAGRVSPRAAADTGVPAGAAIVVGGHDQCCSALGAGLTAGGRAAVGLGTYECITPVFEGIPDLDAVRRIGLNVEHHVLPGLYVCFAFNQAGALVRWFRDTFARERRSEPDLYAALCAEMPEAPTSLLALPYFEPTGAPGYVGDAAGVIAGLRTETTRGEILKALIEGAAFWFLPPLAALRKAGVAPGEFVVTGGGARSDAWLQIKADVFGKPMVRPAITECSLAGAAMLAGLGSGVYATPAEAVAAFVRSERRFEPDAGRHAIYRERAARFDELFRRVRPVLAG